LWASEAHFDQLTAQGAFEQGLQMGGKIEAGDFHS